MNHYGISFLRSCRGFMPADQTDFSDSAEEFSQMNNLEALDYALDIIRRQPLAWADLVERPAAISTLEELRQLIIEQKETGQTYTCIECGHPHWTGYRFIACHIDACPCDCLD